MAIAMDFLIQPMDFTTISDPVESVLKVGQPAVKSVDVLTTCAREAALAYNDSLINADSLALCYSI